MNLMKTDMDDVENTSLEMKNMISKMKNTLKGINSKSDKIEDKLEDLLNETIQKQAQKTKGRKQRREHHLVIGQYQEIQHIYN